MKYFFMLRATGSASGWFTMRMTTGLRPVRSMTVWGMSMRSSFARVAGFRRMSSLLSCPPSSEAMAILRSPDWASSYTQMIIRSIGIRSRKASKARCKAVPISVELQMAVVTLRWKAGSGSLIGAVFGGSYAHILSNTAAQMANTAVYAMWKMPSSRDR